MNSHGAVERGHELSQPIAPRTWLFRAITKGCEGDGNPTLTGTSMQPKNINVKNKNGSQSKSALTLTNFT